jgi:hypothetical protein
MKTNMKEKNIKICREMEAHLNDTMESNAQRLLERDMILQEELNAFEETLLPTQKQNWTVIRDQVDNMRMYAKLGKMRLMDNDENIHKLFAEYQTKLENLDGEEEEAALNIHREMHEPSGIVGIFKSLFMWKDTPTERVKEEKQK